MHMMIKRFVDQGMMTEEQGTFIENAIKNKESVVVSGHRSAGTRPLMASLMAVAKADFNCVQVKGFEDLEKEADFFLIAGIPGIDFGKLIEEAIAVPDTAFISIKEPEHPVSLMKALRDNFKNGTGMGKKIQTLECDKVDDEPKLMKITEMVLNEKGRVERQDY